VRTILLAATLALGVLAQPATAAADPVVGETSVQLEVGATRSMDVGFARGLQCDDLTIVHAELVAASPTSNRLVLRGLKPGRTMCRAGTLGTPTVLVHITVTPKK
jgi:hypothetical protein